MNTTLVRVSDLAEQIRGVSYKKEDASTSPKPGYLPLLRAGNITDEGLIFDDLVFVPAERISKKQKVCRYDVVIAASSGSLDIVGKAAPMLTDFDCGFGAFCKVLRPNSKVHPGYFAHFFKTKDYRQRISALAAGANINNLRNEHLDEMQIPLSPLDEQKRIADILDRAEALRAKRLAALDQLDELVQSMFIDMFGDPVKNPKSWDTTKLGECTEFITSGSRGWAKYYSETGEKFIRIQNVRNGRLDFSDIQLVEPPKTAESIRTKVKDGDLLISITADLGRTAVVDEKTALEGAYINQHLSLIRLNKKIVDPVFVSQYLESEGGKRQFSSLDQKGVKSGLNFENVKSLEFYLPPLDIQKEFSLRIATLEKLKAIHKASLTELDELFSSLQCRAFRRNCN
ncbi:restriction endonuclease subunit S [Methanosarcina barkeri]|uniref:Type I restriction-modification system S subunit HsdS2 n=1 Tax=Methanosarcina barkeri CM1 TaxID=796385 RepID=A0A0G3CCC8_METBA|nr:restriction endonuclease subunit S [Methanosarcina barkeri]AKJ38355.1 type I restriction-modification system S subunit HsdS2 [Methanosarcina barkeri CM1]